MWINTAYSAKKTLSDHMYLGNYRWWIWTWITSLRQAYTMWLILLEVNPTWNCFCKCIFSCCRMVKIKVSLKEKQSTVDRILSFCLITSWFQIARKSTWRCWHWETCYWPWGKASDWSNLWRGYTHGSQGRNWKYSEWCTAVEFIRIRSDTGEQNDIIIIDHVRNFNKFEENPCMIHFKKWKPAVLAPSTRSFHCNF